MVSLPDDYFDYVGEAPLYCRIPCTRDTQYLARAKYDLVEPRRRPAPVESFWTATEGPTAGQTPPVDDPAAEELMLYTLNAVSECRAGPYLAQLLALLKERVTEVRESREPLPTVNGPVAIFTSTYESPPLFDISTCSDELQLKLTEEIERLGGQLAASDEAADVVIYDAPLQGPLDDEIGDRQTSIVLFSTSAAASPSTRVGDIVYHVAISGDDLRDFACGTHTPLITLLERSVADVMQRRHGMPLPSDATINQIMCSQWASVGYGGAPQRLDVLPAPDDNTIDAAIFGLEETENEAPATEQASRTRRRFDWQEPESGDDDVGSPPTGHPTVTITLDMQKQDPRLRLIIDHLQGSRRASRAQRSRVADKYELGDDGLYKIVIKDGEPGLVLAVPRQARAALLAKYHYSLADGGGHAGGQTMYDQLRVDYFWPEMERECHDFVSACHICGGTRSQGTIGADPRASPTPSAPFQVIHVDHKGPLPRSNGYTHVLVVVCALTKFTLYLPVVDTKGSTTLTALQDQVFACFGYPLVIISDNGSFMANNLMKASENLYGYRRVFVMPHTPQANGLAESAVKKLKLILDRHTFEYEGWHALCGMAQTAVNQRVSSGTMECPFTALFGRQPITLTAVENPSLLPSNLPEQRSLRDLAHYMSRLHRRLQHEADHDEAEHEGGDGHGYERPREAQELLLAGAELRERGVEPAPVPSRWRIV